MSQGEESGGEKVHDPTPQRLEEARRKGDVPRSLDTSAAAGILGLFLALAGMGATVVASGGGVLQGFLSNADRLTGRILGANGEAIAGAMVTKALLGMAPIFVLPFCAAFIALLAQRAFVVAPDKLLPKLSRLDPIANFKQKFGPTGLVQFLKSTVKMFAVMIALGLYLSAHRDDILGAPQADPNAVAAMIGDMLLVLVAIACLIFGAIGLIDLLWQRYDHARKLRMSFEDLREEHKQTEGDPHMKQERRQRGQEIATNRMLQDVPKADVIIVNPTHYAVALKWARQPGTAPKCVAKGVDEIAARIREAASEAGVPIHRDPPTARTLHDVVEIGEEIEPEHYRAVAAAIRFADQIRAKARKSAWS